MLTLSCDITLEDFSDFAEKIRLARSKYAIDKKVISEFEKNVIQYDVKNLQLQTGRIDIICEAVLFNCLYFDKNSENLFVTFSGRRNMAKPLPQFVRWKYHTRLPGSLLCIDDPMLRKYQDLAIGWYYGDREENWLAYTATIIKKVAALKKIPPKNIFLFSSSAGGYAALQIGTLLEQANVIAINPQIYPQFWPYAQDFTKITGVNLNADDPFARNIFHERMATSRSKFLIIVNCASKRDFIGQIFPFCQSVKMSPRYGLVTQNNCWLWTYSTDTSYRPHNAFETNSLLSLIIDLIFKIRDDAHINTDIYSIYSDTWNDYYTMCNEKILKNKLLIDKCEIFKQRLKTQTGNKSLA